MECFAHILVGYIMSHIDFWIYNENIKLLSMFIYSDVNRWDAVRLEKSVTKKKTKQKIEPEGSFFLFIGFSNLSQFHKYLCHNL